jgi:ribosome-associated toxin RatA of RatAB toxin-antitoxin module
MTSTPINRTDSTLIPLSPTTIWPVIAHFEEYPQWWPRSLRATVTPASSGLIGTKLHLHPIGSQRFTCTVVSFEKPRFIDLEYNGPVITGKAKWLLEPEGQGTRVSYIIDVTVQGVLAALAARMIDLGRLHSYSMARVFRHAHRHLFPG